jgi:hypothetical protein
MHATTTIRRDQCNNARLRAFNERLHSRLEPRALPRSISWLSTPYIAHVRTIGAARTPLTSDRVASLPRLKLQGSPAAVVGS